MKPVIVTSNNINALGWESDTLFIRFNSGVSYAYENAGKNLFDALAKAESVGQYFHRHIKGKLNYKRLDFDPFDGAAAQH